MRCRTGLDDAHRIAARRPWTDRSSLPMVEDMSKTTTDTSSASTELASARYVRLTTYRRDGTAKHTPVWPVEAGPGRIAFITSAQTWKVRRIAADPRVLLVRSDMKGAPLQGADAVPGVAEVVTGEAFGRFRQVVREKYGYQLRIIDLLHGLPGERTGHRNDCAVVVTLDRD